MQTIKRALFSTVLFIILGGSLLCLTSWLMSSDKYPLKFWFVSQLIVLVFYSVVQMIDKINEFCDDLADVLFGDKDD